MLSVTQVAKLKGLTPDAVRKALADGRLKGERQGRQWRISQLACDAWEPAPRGTWTPTMQIVAGHGAVKGAKLAFDHDGLDTSARQSGEGHVYRHELTEWSRLVVLVVSAGEASCYELAPDTTPLELEGVVPPYGLRGHARVIKQWHGRGAREAFARARGELGALTHEEREWLAKLRALSEEAQALSEATQDKVRWEFANAAQAEAEALWHAAFILRRRTRPFI